MNYKASVNLINKPGSLKGVASVSINDEFVVKGVRIFEGNDGLFVSMPPRKAGAKYEDICFPITKEGRENLHSAVLEVYVNYSQVSRHKKAHFFRGAGYLVCSQYKASASFGVSILSVPCGLFVL